MNTRKHKKQNTNTMCNEKLHKHKKNLQIIAHYALEFQITKSDLRPFTKKL
jgi:hypothetical protein